jgi:hypothetical protein
MALHAPSAPVVLAATDASIMAVCAMIALAEIAG